VPSPRFVLLVFNGGLWDGEELTSLETAPEWISIGASGRYTRSAWDWARSNAEGPSTANYTWAHTDIAMGDSDDRSDL